MINLGESGTHAEMRRKLALEVESRVAGAEHEKKILESIPSYVKMVRAPKRPRFQPRGWIGVDFDGTLATWLNRWGGWDDLGKPVKKMVERVRAWMKLGIEVKIFTARVGKASLEHNGISYSQQAGVIRAWCKKHIGVELDVTAEKDMYMIAFVDDACVQVKQSEGEPMAENGFDVLDKRVSDYLKEVKKHKYDHLRNGE